MENPNEYLNQFLDIDSDLFMATDINKIYTSAKKSAVLHPATHQQISDLQLSLESLSRMKERRELRGLSHLASKALNLPSHALNLLFQD